MGLLQRKQMYKFYLLAVGCLLLLAAHAQGAFPEDAAQLLQASSEYATNLAKLQSGYILSQSNTNPSLTESAATESRQADIAYRRPRGELPDPTRQLRANPINQYNDNVCGLQDIIVPTSTREVAAAVRYFYSLVPPYGPNWREVKLRVASRIKELPLTGTTRNNLGFGESPGFACPRGDSPVARTAVITTNNMRSVLGREGSFVTVQAGMTMSDLIAYANSQQLTIPLGILPAYTDLTVGGLLSTGGHSTGPKGSNALADITVSVTFVDGTGEIHTVDRDCYEGRGLMGGLGMLGVITEVTLKLQPGLGKTRMFAFGPKSDDNIEQDMEDIMDAYDSRVLMSWRPDQGLVKYFVWEEVDPSTPSNPPEPSGLPTIGGPVRPQSNAFLQYFGQGLAAITLDLVNQTTANTLCLSAAYFLADQQWNVVGGTTLTDNVTGLINNIQGSDCSSNPAAGSCFFDLAPFARINAEELADNQTLTPAFTYEENEFALRRQDLRKALSDIKTLARSGFGAPCWPPHIFYARPGGPQPDWISPLSGGPHERFVWLELAFLRSHIPAPVALANPRVQKKLPGLQEFFEQLMVCKYSGRPHWGKSFERMYRSEECPIRDLYPHMHKQLHLQSQYDPAKLFENDLIRTMLSGGGETNFPACSNEMQCYCKTDLDCGSPGKLFCRTAPAPLPPYRICLP